MKAIIRIIILSSSIILIGCTRDISSSLELQILNDKLIGNKEKDSVNVIKYKITNSSNNIYYFNNIVESNELDLIGVYKAGRTIRIYDSDSVEVKYIDKTFRPKLTLEERLPCEIEEQERLIADSKRLGYNKVKRFVYSKGGYINFFIHPKETLFFEYYINITDTMTPYENFRIGYPILKDDQKYYVKLLIASDTTKFEENLPREVIKVIKENNVKVYHGILESQRIPLEVSD